MREYLVFVLLSLFTFLKLVDSEHHELGLPLSQENNELINAKFPTRENISLGANEMVMEDKNITKRRIYANEKNEENFNSFGDMDGYSEMREHGSQKKNSYNEKEIEKKTVNIQQEEYGWNNEERNLASYSPGLENFRGRNEPFPQRLREQKNPRTMYGDNIYEKPPIEVEESENLRFPSAYLERRRLLNDDKRFSTAMGDQHQIKKHKVFSGENEMTGSSYSKYLNYRGNNCNGFESPSYYNPDKGLVINVNTECPMPGHTKSHLVHKLLFTPKSLLTPQASISTFEIPTQRLITAKHVTNPYYYHL